MVGSTASSRSYERVDHRAKCIPVGEIEDSIQYACDHRKPQPVDEIDIVIM